MKTMTIAEFEKLAASTNWKREQEHEVTDSFEREVNEEFRAKATYCSGWAAKRSKLDGISITYQETFSYLECNLESFDSGTDGMDDVWSIQGVIVVDEDGDKLDAYDLADYLSEDFTAIDYTVLDIEQTTCIDIDEESDMETFLVEVDNKPNIKFTGEELAHSSSSDNQAMGSNYSGNVGRWSELTLYKTKGGKYICEQIGRTRWDGERDRKSGEVCETIEEVKAFFGHRWLAKELYDAAGISDTVEVD